MPISVQTDSAKDLTIFTATGDLTFDDQMKVLREFYAGKPTKNALWDFRIITSDKISLDELVQIRDFVRIHQDKRPGGKSALVYDHTKNFGLSEVCDDLTETKGMQFKIKDFETIDDAMKWLEED
jgi:hypothetical protein